MHTIASNWNQFYFLPWNLFHFLLWNWNLMPPRQKATWAQTDLSVETIPDERLNLAEGKLAFQSSTEVHDDMQHNASLATDGSTSIHEETCSMTGT